MTRKNKSIFIFIVGSVFALALLQNCASSSSPKAPAEPCSTFDCTTSKYSLFVADIDGSNVSVIRTSTFQEMTHPRVSNDKLWVAYTAYNELDSENCASLAKGYTNTEIRAIKISGMDDKRIIAPVSTDFNSNSYWIGTTNEFTYLSGPVTSLDFYRATVDANMNLISGPTLIPQWVGIPPTFVPMDPAPHAGSNRLVYPALYIDVGTGTFRKSLFLMDLSSLNPVILTLGRDHAGGLITCADAACENIMENDPKFSPDGTKVAFMRRAPNSGANGFGWHIFVVTIASPLFEKDISWAYIGNDVLKNEGLPEWVDNDTLIFSTIEVQSSTDFVKNVYTMDIVESGIDGIVGSNRTKINLPAGYRYSDVFPFTDGSGKVRMILSAEKIGATCSQ